mmetsp:Transcript_66134/g.147649  ORF Transcript_66134/g.147649 Transcript_66134/m.147649 type:complete len:124 (-) Transcript_66134:443-814(-)
MRRTAAVRCEGRGYGERMSGLSGVCGASHPFPPLGPARSPWRIRSSAELQPSPTHHVPSKANLDAFDKTLKACWEWEVVSEEAIRAWQEDERAARLLQVSVADARRLRERGQAFLEWVDAGEE